jgi:serine/threonine-protein kinase RsbW
LSFLNLNILERLMALLKDGRYKITLKSTVNHLAEVEKITSAIAAEAGFDESSTDDLSIAITELFNNAIHHGNKNDSSKDVTLTYTLHPNYLAIAVADQGKGFIPNSIKNPLAPENLLSESGRGIYLVKMLMDDLTFNFLPDGCEIVIRKNL